MGLAFELIQKNRVLIVRLDGELDHHTADNLRNSITKEMEKNDSLHMILNFEKLTFMDSSGLGVVFGRYKQVKNQGGELIVCHVPPSIHRLFEMSGLFKIIMNTLDEISGLEYLGVTK